MQRVSAVPLFVWAAVLCAVLPAAGTTRADNAPDLLLVVEGLDVAVWPPTDGQAPYPLVLFSHGIGGCNTQSTYLMQALADHGMLVVAPDHKDRGRNCPDGPPTPAEVEKIFIGTHEDRGDDLRELRDALPDEPALSDWPIDSDRVALVGHSLGGYTVLAVAGAWPGWQMGGITAVVALAPYAQPFLNDGAVESISVPVLLQSGGRDSLTPAKNQDVVFAKLTTSACKVVYADAGHLAWTDLETTEFHEATAAATIAFLDEVFAGHPLSETILASSQTDGGEKCK